MKKALLLVNLGTPIAPDYKNLRVYLKQFLSDKRVVNKCSYYWLPLLNLVLLQIIPQKSAKNYAKIWNKQQNESPLLTFTKSQVEKLRKALADDFFVDYAFTYDAGRADRSIEYKIKELTNNGYDNITVLPLYPQYSVSTTASIFEQVADCFKKLEYIPSIKIVDSYYQNDLYTKALANSVENSITDKTTDLVCSFHGVPVKYIEKGDVYQSHCEQTFENLKNELADRGMKVNLHLAYQSQFGRDEWLGPKTGFTIEKLAEEGQENIAVITPGFAVDCIETLEEIAMEAKEEFIQAGGKEFIFIDCLNDSDDAINLFKDIVK
tara:strand:+ start:465 stop:1430 length:966 start_codon:yes stop_codon:yes gene_type:complete